MSHRRDARTLALALCTTALLAGCGASPSASGVAPATPASPPGTSSGPSGTSSGATVRPVASQDVAGDGGLACPGSVVSADGTTVPHPPEGIDATTRLLPQREPTTLVVCAYPSMTVTRTPPLAPPFALGERRVLTGELRSEAVDLLTWSPRWNGREKICTMMASDETAYLVGATYGDAVVWVAALADANTCSRASNGDFVSGAAVGVPLRELLTDQPLPAGPVPADATCGRRSFGRLGDDRSLAPVGDPVVTVCRLAANGQQQETVLDASRSAAAVARLRALDTRTSGQVCQTTSADADRRFTLVLTYPQGPPVRVTVDPSCTPAVLGSALESDRADSLVDLVEQASPPIPAPDPDGSVSSVG